MDGSNRLGFLIFTVLGMLNKSVVLFLVVFLFRGQNPGFLAIDVALYHFLFCIYFFLCSWTCWCKSKSQWDHESSFPSYNIFLVLRPHCFGFELEGTYKRKLITMQIGFMMNLICLHMPDCFAVSGYEVGDKQYHHLSSLTSLLPNLWIQMCNLSEGYLHLHSKSCLTVSYSFSLPQPSC